MSQIIQSMSSASGAGDVLLTTVPTQQLGFGNIQYSTQNLSDDQILCASSCDKPLPRHQDQIVECLKSCGVSSIWERDVSDRTMESVDNNIQYSSVDGGFGNFRAHSDNREVYGSEDAIGMDMYGGGRDGDGFTRGLNNLLMIGGGLLMLYVVVKVLKKN